jgi:hypothetical protein
MKTFGQRLTFRRLILALLLALLLVLGLLLALFHPWQEGEWVTVLDSRHSFKESYIETLEHGRIDVPPDMVQFQIKLIPTRQYRLQLSGWNPFSNQRTLIGGILGERTAPSHLQKR